jgi:predicted nucleotidyltransferase
MDKFTPAKFPELNTVLQELITRLTSLLEADLLGAYLQGSFAVGDYDQHSDVDFIIITENDISGSQLQSLLFMHKRIFELESAWAQHLDFSYFPKDVHRHPPNADKNSGTWTTAAANWLNQFTVVRWTVREHGIALTFPHPDTLVDPGTVELLREEIREVIRERGTEILKNQGRLINRFYQSFIVLSYCRMLHDLQAGSTGSKRTGAKWAQTHLDPSWRDLIDRSREGRPNPELAIRIPVNGDDFAKPSISCAIQFNIEKTNY